MHFTRTAYCLVTVMIFTITNAYAQTKYQKDFKEFCTDIGNHYAYMDQQGINWRKVMAMYEPEAATITTNRAFIQLLEKVLHELYNGHVSLNTNLTTSNRLIPTGLDLYVEKKTGKYYIKDVRKGFGADLCGLKIGMEITLFNGKPIDGQLTQFLPKATDTLTPKMYQYAIDMLFAGTHDVQRAITVTADDTTKTYYPISYGNTNDLLVSKVLNKHTAYIRINNSLGNSNLIAAFDKQLDSLMHYKNLIIDLTETPSGGNTTVARSIMGRFIAQPLPYQTHRFDEKAYETQRYWTEYVVPRKTTYTGKVYVLVSHWTGSMGEGIAIGFDGMQRATVIGTRMAGLLGAISGFGMTETGIGFQIPTERLYHVNGTPREEFIPPVLTENMEETFKKAREIL